MQIIDGKKIAENLRQVIAQEILTLNIKPSLHVILVGDHPASQIYVNNKQKACGEVGITSTVHKMPESTTEAAVLSLIQKLNMDDAVHGILLQLPLPDHINKNNLLNAISPLKDVDGLSPYNLGQLFANSPNLVPCTPKGCMHLIASTGTNVSGKTAVVVGRSVLVGRPMAALLTNADATVTVAHSKTTDLKEICKSADILVVAAGSPKLIDAEYIKDGAVVIDVGINRIFSAGANEDAKTTIVGDVDFESVQNNNKNCQITPVPGGVGPMTVASLLQNTVEAMKLQTGAKP